MVKKIFKALIAIVAIYGVLTAALFILMLQGPDRFAGVMRYVLGPPSWSFPSNRSGNRSRRHPQRRRSRPISARNRRSPVHRPAFFLPRTQAGRSRLRQLHLTALPAGGSRPQFLVRKYKDQVAFYAVYIREAHTSDVWQDPDNVDDHVIFAAPKNMDQRTEMGKMCVVKLGIKFPAVLDNFQNTTERDYTGWPDRLYVIDRDGRIAFKAAPVRSASSPRASPILCKPLCPTFRKRTSRPPV